MIRIREAGLVAAGAITLAACTSGGGVGAGTTASSAPATSPSTSPETSQSPAPGASPGGRLQQVKERGSVRVCTTGDYRPFTYKDPRTGAYSGIDVTMAQDLAARLGVKVEWVPTTWKTLMPDFTARCDIGMGGISISTDRLHQAFFTEPLLTEGKTPITLCSKVADYDTVAEINKPGVRSITPIGGTNEKFAVKHYPQGRIIRWKDNNTIFDEIIAGRADVMTTDASETVWVASTHPQLCAVHPDKPFDFSQKGYLLPQGDVVWEEVVDGWLAIAKRDGTYTKAAQPWFKDKPLTPAP